MTVWATLIVFFLPPRQYRQLRPHGMIDHSHSIFEALKRNISATVTTLIVMEFSHLILYLQLKSKLTLLTL